MKTLTKEEILKGCEHDGSFIPVNEVKRVMQEYSDQENARLTAINAKQAELIKRFLKGNLEISMCDYSVYQKLREELFALQSGEKEEKTKDAVWYFIERKEDNLWWSFDGFTINPETAEKFTTKGDAEVALKILKLFEPFYEITEHIFC